MQTKRYKRRDIDAIIKSVSERYNLSPEVIDLIDMDLCSGMTRKDIEKYCSKNISLERMQLISECIRHNMSDEAVEKLSGKKTTDEDISVVYELVMGGVQVGTIEKLTADHNGLMEYAARFRAGTLDQSDDEEVAEDIDESFGVLENNPVQDNLIQGTLVQEKSVLENSTQDTMVIQETKVKEESEQETISTFFDESNDKKADPTVNPSFNEEAVRVMLSDIKTEMLKDITDVVKTIISSEFVRETTKEIPKESKIEDQVESDDGTTEAPEKESKDVIKKEQNEIAKDEPVVTADDETGDAEKDESMISTSEQDEQIVITSQDNKANEKDNDQGKYTELCTRVYELDNRLVESLNKYENQLSDMNEKISKQNNKVVFNTKRIMELDKKIDSYLLNSKSAISRSEDEMLGNINLNIRMLLDRIMACEEIIKELKSLERDNKEESLAKELDDSTSAKMEAITSENTKNSKSEEVKDNSSVNIDIESSEEVEATPSEKIVEDEVKESVKDSKIVNFKDRTGRVAYSTSFEVEKKRSSGLGSIAANLCMKKRSRRSLMQMVLNGELDKKQLTHIVTAIKSGLTENQLVTLIESKVDADSMPQIIEIAKLENEMGYTA